MELTTGLPLEGIRVLELARTVAGPFCAMTLADMGAEVIKIEEPRHGDETRAMAPLWNGEGAVYLAVNRNKRSIGIDIKTDEGRELVLALAEKADVLIENFRAGTADRLGLGYDVVSARNPRIVYCSISGFGRTGPVAQKPAYDFILQGYGGLMSVTGTPDGEPVRVGYPTVDVTAGLLAYGGIMTALWVRERTGRGQHVSSSLLAGQVATMSHFGISAQATGRAPQPMGSAVGPVVPYQAFQAADRPFLLAVGNDGLWRRFCPAMGHPEWLDDPRFVDNTTRVENREVLVGILTEIFRTRTAAEWVELLGEAGVPAGLIHTVPEVIDDPQVLHEELYVPLPHPKIPELRVGGVPVKLSETPGKVRTPPPRLGEHTGAILQELGLGTERVAALAEAGVISRNEAD